MLPLMCERSKTDVIKHCRCYHYCVSARGLALFDDVKQAMTKKVLAITITEPYVI
jgi:hypothetical protein